MEAPRNIAGKKGGSNSKSPKASVEMGQMVVGKDTPERSAQDDVMKQKVTELLMTLGDREQAVRARGERFVIIVGGDYEIPSAPPPLHAPHFSIGI